MAFYNSFLSFNMNFCQPMFGFNFGCFSMPNFFSACSPWSFNNFGFNTFGFNNYGFNNFSLNNFVGECNTELCCLTSTVLNPAFSNFCLHY